MKPLLAVVVSLVISLPASEQNRRRRRCSYRDPESDETVEDVCAFWERSDGQAAGSKNAADPMCLSILGSDELIDFGADYREWVSSTELYTDCDFILTRDLTNKKRRR